MSLNQRYAVSVFFMLALTYVQFFQASTWGSASRFDLATALVERQTVVIDAYHENTGDKALLNGHYYSDKAPLPSFLAVPGIALAKFIRPLFSGQYALSSWLATAGGMAAFFASGLVTALGGCVFFLALCDRGIGLSLAWVSTLFVWLGTTLFPYATVIQGHAPAASWLFIFYYLIFPVGGGPPGKMRRVFAGAAASAALSTEYLTGPPLLLIGLLSIVRHREMAVKHTILVVSGALPGLLLLGTYHTVAFGGPLNLGYQHVALPFFQEKMSSGLFGITLPDGSVAFKLLFGSFRGLFFACPVLLAAVPGTLFMLKRKELRWDVFAIYIIFFYYWLINAGYSTWSGGWAIGPRHMVPGVPFLGLGIPFILSRWPVVVSGAGCISIFFMLAATAVQPEVPDAISNPVFDHLIPHFVKGELSVGEQGFGELLPGRSNPAVPDRWDAFLLGEATGLSGTLALLPVLFVWVSGSLQVLIRRQKGS